MIKTLLLQITPWRHAWAAFRSHQLVSRYRSWSEKYGHLAKENKLSYDLTKIRQEVQSRLKGNGVQEREKGSIHTVIMTMTSNWGIGMVQELQELGPVSLFDNEIEGFSEASLAHSPLFPELNRRFLEFLQNRHAERPVDWVLLPCSGNLILKDTLRRIRQDLGIPIVNQWLDCKQNFECGVGPYGQDSGQKDIAPEFDLVWTSSRSVCEWYLALGARPIFLPEGFSPQLTPRVDCEKKYEVGFLGACYGLRPDYIKALRKAGLKVVARGFGWPGAGSVSLTEMGRFFGECKVNLGMGGVGYSMELTTLKGRDFEVPGAGGAYLTTYNADLANFFHIGREILCYHSIEEMVELACRLVQHDDFREELAARAYARSMQEHRWLHRFQVILEILGILHSESGNGDAPFLAK